MQVKVEVMDGALAGYCDWDVDHCRSNTCYHRREDRKDTRVN